MVRTFPVFIKGLEDIDHNLFTIGPGNELFKVSLLMHFAHVFRWYASAVGRCSPASFRDNNLLAGVGCLHRVIVLPCVSHGFVDGFVFPGGVGVNCNNVHCGSEPRQFVEPRRIIFAKGHWLSDCGLNFPHIIYDGIRLDQVVCPVNGGLITRRDNIDNVMVSVRPIDEAVNLLSIFQCICN